MMFADMGAEVIRVDRPRKVGAPMDDTRFDITARSRRSLAIDLKKPTAAGSHAAYLLQSA
jgi:alpha-methylacyl-CoA racemase